MERWRRNAVVVWTANLITAVGMMAVVPFLPLHLEQMGIGDAPTVRIWSGVITGAAPLVAAFMAPVWGALGDRLGRKVMIVRANMAITVFVGLMAFAPGPWSLLALRLLQGLFSGYIAPSITLVSVDAPENRQAGVAGTLQTGVLVGMLGGAFFGGAIADRFGFETVFLITSALSLVAVLVVSLFAVEPSTDGEGNARPPLTSALRDLPVVELMRRVLADVAILLGGGPMRTLLIAVFTLRFGSALADPILALFVPTLDGVDPERVATTTGYTHSVRAAATLFCTPLWAWIGDRHGYGRTLILCGLGTGLAQFPQALVTTVEPLLFLRFASGAFMAGVLPAVYALSSRSSTREQRGGAHGLAFSSLALAFALGPLAGGFIAAALSLRSVFVVSSVLMVTTVIVIWRSKILDPFRSTPGPGASSAVSSTT